MKKILKFIIAFLGGLVVFCFVLTGVGWSNLIDSFKLFFGKAGLVLVVLTVVMVLVASARWKLIFQSQNNDFDLAEVGKLWTAGYAVSYITPVAFFGGEALRVYLAKKKLGLSWKKSVASVVIDKLLDATLFSAITVIGILIFLFYSPLPSGIMIWGSIALILLMGGGISFFYFKALRKESAMRFLLKWVGMEKQLQVSKNSDIIFKVDQEMIAFFSPQHKYFWQGLGLSFIKYFLFVLRAGCLVYFLQGIIAPFKSFAVYAFANLATLLPFPAALGGMETLQGLAFKGLGFRFASGTVFAMTWRAPDFMVAVLGIVFLSKFGLDLLQKKILGSMGTK